MADSIDAHKLPFQYDRTTGIISGHGLTWLPADQPEPGCVMLSVDLLNRLVKLIEMERRLGSDDADQVLKRNKDRIQAAKDDLIEEFNLDPELAR